MISSLIGSVIMSAVTVAMLLAIDITDKALKKLVNTLLQFKKFKS